MKTYRYANLLAIFVSLLVGLTSIGTQTNAFFTMPATAGNTDNQPSTTSNSSLTLPKIETAEQKSTGEIASHRTSATTKTICQGFYGSITFHWLNKTVCLDNTNNPKTDKYGNENLSYNHSYITTNYCSPGRTDYCSHNKYAFGHNTASQFGNLLNLPIGAVEGNYTFSVTLNGRTATYKISQTKKYLKTDLQKPAQGWEPIIPSKVGADFSIMTCDGQSVGNGDATHRRVVYANRI